MKYGMIPSPLDPITDWFYKQREVIVVMVIGTVGIASFIWLVETILPKLYMTQGETILLGMFLLNSGRSCDCKCSKK